MTDSAVRRMEDPVDRSDGDASQAKRSVSEPVTGTSREPGTSRETSTETHTAPSVRIHTRPATAEESAVAPELTKSTRDRLVRLAYRFLWNLDDAEDVVHEALTAAHQRIARLRDRQKWWSWVRRIVVRRCHEHGRRKLRRERHEDGLRVAAERTESERADAGHAPHRNAEAGRLTEGADQLRRLVLELPRRQKEVVVLRHLQGMGYDEIAEVLGISVSTARVHAQTGREKLKDLLLTRHASWFDH